MKWTDEVCEGEPKSDLLLRATNTPLLTSTKLTETNDDLVSPADTFIVEGDVYYERDTSITTLDESLVSDQSSTKAALLEPAAFDQPLKDTAVNDGEKNFHWSMVS